MNINKLFPRLSIRAKLSIAFGLLAVAPVVLLAGVATRVTVPRLRERARASLEHDVASTRVSAEQLLDRLGHDVAFLAAGLLAEALEDHSGPLERQVRTTREFLSRHPALFQVRVIAGDGTIVFASRTSASTETSDGTSGLYYALRGRGLRPGERLVQPVEVRGEGGKPFPAIAVAIPVWDAQNTYRGVVVGEAAASVVLGRLDDHSPELPGTTILFDPSGLLLYHSERKRDWTRLLARDPDTNWLAELALRSAQEGDAWPPRTLTLREHLVTATTVALGRGNDALTLVRAVPLATINAPVREFLQWTLAAGSVIVIVVMGLALIAARQMTQPIVQLQHSAAQLAGGDVPAPLRIETNDELEDLARDFAAMAAALTAHRRELENMVAERTRELRRTHAELAGVLEHAADAIIGTDTERRVRFWNRGAEQLFGYTEHEVLGRDVDELLLPPDGERSAERDYRERELKRTGAVVNLPTTRKTKDGTCIPVNLTESRIADADGAPHGVSLIIRDARVQQQVEDHMRRSERLAAISVMAAGLAHELNNPLAIITNRIECMEAELETIGDFPNLRADLAVLREHASRLGDTTRDLLRFAREKDESTARVNLRDVAARLARLLERTLIGRDIRVRLTGAETIPPVLGSESALETVCMNLMLNAADAMPDGGTIEIETSCDPERNMVALRVADEGPGVPRDLRERIFEPFFTTKGVRGTGLGLSLCRSIVERHGGRIWVDDAPGGRGCVFVVALHPAEGPTG